MDAKITKQRLANLLSYDWLKIIAVVIVAVALIALFFTMVGTRPTQAQTYSVFCYTGLSTRSEFTSLSDSLERGNVFSYDILKINVMDLSTDETYASTLFTTRRAAGEGTVMFAADVPVENEDGEQHSSLVDLTGVSVYDGVNAGVYYDTRYFLNDCKDYLETFFGAGFDVDSGIDAAAAQASFLARNGRDKRYRTTAQIGAADEEARLESLRDDYLFVSEAFAEGTLTHAVYETEAGTFAFGISLGGLKNIGDLVYCNTDGVASPDPVTLMIFCNDYGAGNDLRFETVSFLRYLVERYGAGA